MSSRNVSFNRSPRSSATVLGAAVLLGLSGLALAATPPAPPGPPGPPAFATMDANGDGRVSADEFGQFRAQRMAARAAEGRPMRNAANAPTFQSLDTNGDGYLTQAEVSQHMAARGGCGRGPGGGGGWGNGPGPGAGQGGRPCGGGW